jgi:NADH-quinone oxidoreductase chain G
MTNEQTICLTIDGQEIQCDAGCTVYEAATGAGIHIPTFCHHEKLVPVGACRMCLVEIEGARGLQTSCTTPVREGMVVKVHTSPAAVKARKANLEFLLTNHPLDCPVCDKGGECPLQNQALQDGPGQSRYVEPKRHKAKRKPLGEFIVIDQERCVLCWRCIRFLDEWAGDHQLDLFGRGAETRLDTFPGRPLTSKWQGNTIDICPVGALTSRVFRFEARVWELCNTPSICPLCAVGCNLVLGEKNNELRRITPRENLEVNDAWLCDRGRFGHAFVDHPDRLATPLVRRNGELQPATWDEALDLVARRLREIVEADGPQAIGGLGSARSTNEANYLFQRFLRTVVGTNNVDHLGRMPAGATPLRSLPDLERRDVFVLLGFDPSSEAPLIELWIKKAVLRHGAQVIVVNPWQIELAAHGGSSSMSLWLGYRPGGEAALLNGLARAILDAGGETRQGAARTTNLDEFRAWLRNVNPSPEMRQAAERLAQARRPILLYGPRWAGGIDPLANLALLLGGAEVAFVPEEANTLGALEMGVAPDLYPGRQPFRDTQVRSRLASFWGGKLSPLDGLDCNGMLAAAREGRLQAMWVVGSDPASECRAAGEALGRLPFLVVQDLFLTETAQLAEVVLPAASFAEIEGSYVNLTGRVQRLGAALRPPGHRLGSGTPQARADWAIITDVAQRMLDTKRRKMWDFSTAADILDEIAKVVPAYRGLDYARMGEQGWQPPIREPAARRAFTRVEPESPIPNTQYPLTLITGRLFYDRGTLLSRSAPIQNVVPEAFVMLHPSDAAKLGLADGDEVTVESAQGQLQLRLKVSDDVAPGVAYAPLNLSAVPLNVLFAERQVLPRVRIVK